MPKQVALVLTEEQVRDLADWLAFCRRRVEADQSHTCMLNCFKSSLGPLQDVVGCAVTKLVES